MRRNYIEFICIILSISLFYSCRPDNIGKVDGDCDKRLKQLEGEILNSNEFINSLNLELSDINTSLERIEEVANSDSLGIGITGDASLKIFILDSLFQESTKKVVELENKLALESDNGKSELLQKVVNNLKATLLEKERIIIHLKFQNDSLTTSNFNLIDSLESESSTNISLNNELDQKKSQLRGLENSIRVEKENLAVEVRNLKYQLERTKSEIDIEKANAYYSIGVSLFEEFNNTNSGLFQSGKNKLRRELLNDSYEYFRKACILGNLEASNYIRRLLTDENYSKELDISRSQVQLTKCGI